jgi:hypothetical protein
MPRLRPPAWCGVRSGAQDGMSDARSGARDGTSDVRSGAQVQLPAQVQLQLPAQPSNSTGSAKSLIEPVAQPPCAVHAVIRHSLAMKMAGYADRAALRGGLSAQPALRSCFAGERKDNSMPRLRQNNATGKSLKTCPALSQKIFRFRRRANQRYQLAPSHPTRGALAIVTKRGAGCGGRGWAFDERP